MFSFLKNHPFPVEAFFEKSIVLTFAIPKEDIKDLIPGCLTLDTFDDKWAFIAVALVETSDLMPKGFPKFMGNDFFLVGYRFFVRYTTSKGKKLRGLYILKSETNKRKMEILGNIFTHYNYSTTDIQQKQNENKIEIKSAKSGFHFEIEIDEAELPITSPFPDWKTARKFAGPLPFTFTYNAATKNVLIIEGVRQNWQPAPVKVNHFHFSFLKPFENARLANAFIISKIPYYWKRGRLDKWNQ